MQTEALLSPNEFSQVRDLVYRQCGIHLHDGKMDLVRARITRRLRAHRCDTVSQYLERLDDDDGSEITQLIDEMSTNLTSFFREPQHFTYLQSQLLPALLARKRIQKDNRLRFWSSACSSGQEPYTLGMALAHSIPDLTSWDVKILATDISTRVLANAEQATYDVRSLQEIPPQYRRYIVTDESSPLISIDPAIRAMVRFRRLNLIGPWPFAGPFDVIFCRNVLIYFDQPTQEKLVQRFHQVLSPGGMLMTGHSESLNGLKHSYGYVQPAVYQKEAA